MSWEIFSLPAINGDPTDGVILNKGYIYFRSGLNDKYNLDQYVAVELYADSKKRLIVFHPVRYTTNKTFMISRNTSSVRCSAFMEQAKTFGYPLKQPLAVRKEDDLFVIEKPGEEKK